MGGLRIAYFSGFVADLIISFVGASCILLISIIYLLYILSVLKI